MLSHGLKALRRAEMILAGSVFVVIVACVFLSTVFRYSGSPLIWTDEVAQAAFVWLSMLAADLTLQRAGHFKLDVVVGFLPPRARTVLDLFVDGLIAALLIVLIVNSWSLLTISHPRPLPITGVPSSFAIAALPIGFILMLITMAERAILQARGQKLEESQPRDVT